MLEIFLRGICERFQVLYTCICIYIPEWLQATASKKGRKELIPTKHDSDIAVGQVCCGE